MGRVHGYTLQTRLVGLQENGLGFYPLYGYLLTLSATLL